MKKWNVFVLAAMCGIVLAGCGGKEVRDAESAAVAQKSTAVAVKSVAAVEESTTMAVETEAAKTAASAEPVETEASEVSEYEVLFGCLKMTLPESWREDVYYEVSYSEEDTSFMVHFYEEPDYSDFGGGWLCGVLAFEGNDPESYRYLPHFDYLGEAACPDGAEYGVVVEYPTDVQPSIEQMESYFRLYEDIDQLIASIEPLDVAEFYWNSGGLNEYILPFSDMFELYEDDLVGLTEDELRIARNEIFARHGRRFKDPELQAYFDNCAWYEGRIAPEDFDESVLSDVEKRNLKVIEAFENFERDTERLSYAQGGEAAQVEDIQAQGMAGDYNLEGWQTSDYRDSVEEGFLFLAENGDGLIYMESLGQEMQVSWYDAGDDVVAIRFDDNRYEGYYYPELGHIRIKIGEKVYYFRKV